MLPLQVMAVTELPQICYLHVFSGRGAASGGFPQELQVTANNSYTNAAYSSPAASGNIPNEPPPPYTGNHGVLFQVHVITGG